MKRASRKKSPNNKSRAHSPVGNKQKKKNDNNKRPGKKYSFSAKMAANNYSSLPVSTNSYRVPPVKREHLKTIRKREFMCFNKLKPKKLNLKSLEESQGIDQVEMRYDSVKDTLKLSTKETDKVRTYSEWMVVWNIFTQAHLHFHPEDSHNLFSYQKIVTRFSAKYTFEAVYAYDIDFRNLISSEGHLPPHERQARWMEVNEELVDINLRDNRKPDPQCFQCGQKGQKGQKKGRRCIFLDI